LGGSAGGNADGYVGGAGGNGDASTTNGGTIKLFYGTFSGTKPSASQAGRIYDAGENSALAP